MLLCLLFTNRLFVVWSILFVFVLNCKLTIFFSNFLQILNYTLLQQMNDAKTDKDNEQQPMISDDDKKKLNSQQSSAITYGQTPISMKCPYCLQHIRSEIIMKPQFISVALGMSIFAIVPNFMMILLVIILMQFTASQKHRCPLCQKQLGSDGKFLLYFQDEVISFSLFSAGFIFTKKMLFTGLMIAFTIGILSLRVAYANEQKWVTTTWPEYVSECSSGNPSICLNKYKTKQFQNWSGHLMRMIDNRESNSKWYLHALSLFVKMNPDTTHDNKPDVLLTLNSDAVFYNSEILRNLQHGDLMRFNCTLHERERGSLKDVMHFHVEKLEIIGHDSTYAMYTTQIQEEWIQVHVQNREKLRRQIDNQIKPN